MKSSVKSIVIKISIAFLAIIALLTYFSGTIDNYLLPHVTVTYGGEDSLKYQYRGDAVYEQTSFDPTDITGLQFRFTCNRSAHTLVRIGASMEVKAQVEAEENRFVYRDGKATVIGTREVEDGIECTAQMNTLELLEGESVPATGDAVLIDTTFTSQKYAHIVMKTAIRTDSQNIDYVYLVTKSDDGKRSITKTTVTILDESDFYAAVDMSDGDLPIVLTSSKEIHEGQRVIVDG